MLDAIGRKEGLLRGTGRILFEERDQSSSIQEIFSRKKKITRTEV